MTDQAPWPFPKSRPETVAEEFPSLDDLLDDLPDITPTYTVSALQEALETYKVRMIHMHVPGTRGGCTVVYRPTNPNSPGCKTLEIAVAYTHPKDSYNKKMGAEIAASRWLGGNTVVIPARGKSVHETIHNLWNIFYYSIYGLKY